MGMTQIIAENLQISEETASNFLDNFDVKPEKIRYCGRVKIDDILEEMIRGTEYWIADCEGYVYWGNKEPQCSQWDEETANAIGLPFGDYETEMEDYHMHTGCAFCRKNHPVNNVIKFNKMSNAFHVVCRECYSTHKDRNSK